MYLFPQVDTLDAALTAERQKTADERTALAKSHSELSRLKKELQETKERLERETQNDHYYQVKVRIYQACICFDDSLGRLFIFIVFLLLFSI